MTQFFLQLTKLMTSQKDETDSRRGWPAWREWRDRSVSKCTYWYVLVGNETSDAQRYKFIDRVCVQKQGLDSRARGLAARRRWSRWRGPRSSWRSDENRRAPGGCSCLWPRRPRDSPPEPWRRPSACPAQSTRTGTAGTRPPQPPPPALRPPPAPPPPPRTQRPAHTQTQSVTGARGWDHDSHRRADHLLAGSSWSMVLCVAAGLI